MKEQGQSYQNEMNKRKKYMDSEKSKKFYDRRAAIEAARKRKQDETQKQQTQAKQNQSKVVQNRNIGDTGREDDNPRKSFKR